MGVHHPFVAFKGVVEALFENLGSCYQIGGVCHKIEHDPPFSCSKIDLLAVDLDFVYIFIDQKGILPIEVFVLVLTCFSPLVYSSEESLDSQNQLLWAEGFCNIVVCSELEA